MAKAKKLPSGNWRTRVFIGKDNGKKQYKSFTARSKKESEYMAIEYLMNNRIKKETDIYKSVIADVVKDYIEANEQILSPNTIRGYWTIYRNQIQDLKLTKIEDFTATVHQRWIDNISKDLAPKSVKNINGLLVTALRYYNVALDPIKLPQKEYKKIYVPTTDEVKQIIKYFEERNNKDMVIACYLASVGTLRRGEVCALTADDIDRKNNTITINKAIALDSDNYEVLKTPKTYSSNRTIELPAFLIDMLPKKGKVINIKITSLTLAFARAKKKLNMPNYTFHSLRHYSASIMHAQNIPTQYIMERGGWKTEETLKRIYRNSLDDYQQKFSRQTNNFFTDNLAV